MNNNSKRLIKKTGIYFIGNLSSKILSTILVPIYAFYINTNDLGYFDFTQTIMSIISPIIMLAIWEAILKYLIVENNEDEQNKIVSTSAIFSLVSIITLIVLAVIYNYFFNNSIVYLGQIVFMISIQTVVTVWQYYARSFKQTKDYVLAGIFSTVVNFILVIIFVVIFKFGLLGLLLSYNFGQIVAFLILERKMHILKRLKLNHFKLKTLKKLIKYSSPLVLNLVSLWGISGFSRMIVTLKLGAEFNGLYSFSSKFSSVLAMLGSVLTMAIIEESILLIKNKDFSSQFEKTINKTIYIFFALAIMVIPALTIFYNTIQKTDYFASRYLTPWLLMYAIFTILSTSVGSVFQALDRTRQLLYTTLLGGVLSVLLILLLINTMGLRGVVIAQTLGALIMLIARCVLANKLIGLKVHWLHVLGLVCIFVITTIICFTNEIVISVLIFIVVLGLLTFINRVQIKNIYLMLKKTIK